MATPESKLANAKLRVGEPECNVLPEVVETRRKIRPPIQPVCEKEDIILRDLRTWHAGMLNESDDYRVMIALGYKGRHSESFQLRTLSLDEFGKLTRECHRHYGTPTIRCALNFQPVKRIIS